MATYSILNQDQAQKILHLYGNFQIKELQALSTGISNSNYCVSTQKGELVLKISNDKGPKELLEEQEILQFLQQSGFKYSLGPLKTLNGELVYHLPPFWGVVYPFIKGEVPKISAQTCQEMGIVLGELHLISQKKTIPENVRRYSHIGDDAQKITAFINNPKAPKDFIQTFYQVFPQGLGYYINLAFPTGLIHGDFYYDNTLFKDGKLQVVLDFEQAGIGQFILDLGIAIGGSCLELCNNIWEISPKLIQAFINGYELKRKLDQIEKNQLTTSIYLGLFSIALWRIKRFTVGNLDPSKKNSYQELLLRVKRFKSLEKS